MSFEFLTPEFTQFMIDVVFLLKVIAFGTIILGLLSLLRFLQG